MTNDRFTKILVSIVAAMLFINLLYAVIAVSTPVGKQSEGAGQYLISNWSVQSGAHVYHTGSAPDPAAESGPGGTTNMQSRGR